MGSNGISTLSPHDVFAGARPHEYVQENAPRAAAKSAQKVAAFPGMAMLNPRLDEARELSLFFFFFIFITLFSSLLIPVSTFHTSELGLGQEGLPG